MSKNIISGIYKITSPSKRIYIGQSVSIIDRWKTYKNYDCKSQIKLFKSFKKYTVEEHIFEIIEQCPNNKLTERELFWQKFYNSVKEGLNCKYVSENYCIIKKRRAFLENLPDSVNDILDTQTGIFYYGFVDLTRYYQYSRGTLTDMLKGESYNNTSLILAEDYEKGKTPQSLLKEPLKFNRQFNCSDDFVIINFTTKEEVGSIKTTAKNLKIKETTLRSYMTGIASNPTDYIFKRDYLIGLTPTNLCNTTPVKIKVINFNTGEIFNSIKEVSEKYNISIRTVSNYLENKDISRLPIVKLTEYSDLEEIILPLRNIEHINRKIIDINTKEVFENHLDVANRYNISKDMVSKFLGCKCNNSLGIIYKDEYDKGLLPNHNYKGGTTTLKKSVVDITTGIKYKSIREACRELNLNNSVISHKLKNDKLDGVSLRYE